MLARTQTSRTPVLSLRTTKDQGPRPKTTSLLNNVSDYWTKGLYGTPSPFVRHSDALLSLTALVLFTLTVTITITITESELIC